MSVSNFHDRSESIGLVFLIKFHLVNYGYIFQNIISMFYGVDALRVRQLQASHPGRKVVNPPAVPRMSRMSTIKSQPGPCSEEGH